MTAGTGLRAGHVKWAGCVWRRCQMAVNIKRAAGRRNKVHRWSQEGWMLTKSLEETTVTYGLMSRVEANKGRTKSRLVVLLCKCFIWTVSRPSCPARLCAWTRHWCTRESGRVGDQQPSHIPLGASILDEEWRQARPDAALPRPPTRPSTPPTPSSFRLDLRSLHLGGTSNHFASSLAHPSHHTSCLP